MLKMLIMGVFSLCVVCGGAQAATNLITNGGFETGDFTGYTTSNLNDTEVLPTGQGIYESEAGSFYVNLGNAGFPGTISQTFADTAGTRLSVSFAYATNGSQGFLTAKFNDIPIFTTVNPNTNGAYVTFTSEVTATGSDTLTFLDRDDLSGYALDTISVSELTGGSIGAPGPIAGAGLFPLIGLVGLLALRKRSRP